MANSSGKGGKSASPAALGDDYCYAGVVSSALGKRKSKENKQSDTPVQVFYKKIERRK